MDDEERILQKTAFRLGTVEPTYQGLKYADVRFWRDHDSKE